MLHFKINSIFLKLLSIIIGTGIIIIIGFIIFFRIHFSSRLKEQFNVNAKNYFTYIAKDIGSPPDTNKAKFISNKYFLIISYEGKGVHWQYGNNTIPGFGNRKRLMKFAVGIFKEEPFIFYNPDGSRFIFTADFHRMINPGPHEAVILILFLLIILSLNYLIIKKVLSPIKHLTVGVNELSKGNLDHSIPVRSSDELSALSRSFNEMTKKIKDMIHARDQLLLDVSHELRSPLTRIKVALEFIKDEKNKESISSDVKEIEMMITEILESERLKDDYGKLKLVPCNLRDLFNDILEQYQGKKPGIILQNVPDNLELAIDKERIKLVIKNILDNAIKYSHLQSRAVTISIEELPGKVIILIKDDGTGIPDEDLPFIFEPFFRVDKSRTRKTGGYGLGLSLCKKIIEAHGGKITIANNHDRGITVRIELNK